MTRIPGMPVGGARERGPSMADVAALAGVSHQTVSRVLNGAPMVRPETRERVEAAIRTLGYRRNSAARLLVTNRSRRIGLISAHLALHGPSRIAVAVQEAGARVGYDVSLLAVSDFAPDTLRGAVDRLLDESVEAVIVAAAHRSTLEAARALDLAQPVVVVQGVRPGQPLAAGVDQEAGAMLAAGHLLDLGHRWVAHVSGPLDWLEAGQRRDGWRRAHEERGLLPGPELSGDWSPGSGYEAGLAIANEPDVTAVFAANDDMALGVMKALHDCGRRVPHDVSVVGFDDIPQAAFLWPALTTVSQPFTDLGRHAVDLAVRAIGGEHEPVGDLVQPRLVERASTAPPDVAAEG